MLVVDCLRKGRGDIQFDMFWDVVEKERARLDIAEAVLPRKKKIPQRFEEGSSEAFHHNTPKDHYRQIFFAAYDSCIQYITERFQQQIFLCTKLCKSSC